MRTTDQSASTFIDLTRINLTNTDARVHFLLIFRWFAAHHGYSRSSAHKISTTFGELILPSSSVGLQQCFIPGINFPFLGHNFKTFIILETWCQFHPQLRPFTYTLLSFSRTRYHLVWSITQFPTHPLQSTTLYMT